MTPYIHALVYHVPEMLARCAAMGIPLRFFSAEPVEGKNHVHVHRFFASTHRDGGWPGESAEVELMQIERRLFYDTYVLSLPSEASKPHVFVFGKENEGMRKKKQQQNNKKNRSLLFFDLFGWTVEHHAVNVKGQNNVCSVIVGNR